MSSPNEKKIPDQQARRGVQFPPREPAAAVVEQKKIAKNEGSPPNSPRYSSEDDSEEKRERRRRSSRSDSSIPDDSDREIIVTYSDDGEDCEILSSNIDETKKDEPCPPEGNPPAKANAEMPKPPTGSAPEAPVAKDQTAQKPKIAHKANFPKNLEVLPKILPNLPQNKCFAADQTKEQLCNTCNKQDTMRYEVTFRGKKVVTCSDSCFIKNLQMRTSGPAENDAEHNEMKKIAIALAKHEHDTHGVFKPLKPYHDEIMKTKTMRDTVRVVEEAAKKFANNMPVDKVKSHRTSLEALKAILKDTYKQYIDTNNTMFGEEYEEILEAYFTGNPKARREAATEARKTAEELRVFETEKQNAETLVAHLKNHLLPKIAELLEDAPEIYKKLKMAKADVAEYEELLLKCNEDFVASLDDEETFADASKIRVLTNVLMSLQELGCKEMKQREQQAAEAEKTRKLENKAFQILIKSNSLKDDEKDQLKNYDPEFNDEGPPFGITFFKNKILIKDIQEMLYCITDFAVLKQDVAFIAKEDHLIMGAAMLRCRLEDAEKQRYVQEDIKENKTLKEDLHSAATTIVELRNELKEEKAKKEVALADAEEKARMLFDTETRLAELQSFKEMALNIGEKDRRASSGEQRRQNRGGNDRHEEKAAPEEGHEWRVVDYGRGRVNPRAQNRDNRDADQRKRGADEYSHFGLRDKDNQPYCQFQFTNAEGCNKKEKCRYANTHGMEDPHPGHESRNRKRPKKSAAPAAKDNDEKPRNAKRDDRDRDDGNKEWGNDLNNID